MWGNWLGWTISAVLLVASGAGFYKLAVPPPESAPSNLIPADLMRDLKLPEETDKLVPRGTRNADAGGLYAQALLRFKTNSASYKTPANTPLADMPAINLVRQARDYGRMSLFESRPQVLINYDNELPDLDALIKIADATDTYGLGQLLDGKTADAKEFFAGVFALGRHLFDERVSWREMSAGIGMMSDGAQNLAKVSDKEGDGARGTLLHHLQEELDKYRAHLQEKIASPLTNPVESYASQYAGDIFAIARDPSVERVWRVQAILHIGRYKWNVADGHRGDQVWGHRILKMLKNSPDTANGDPVIQTAIDAAMNLTLDQQRKSIAM